MDCPVCNSSLEEDSDIDSGNTDSTCCTHNFKCTNEDCAKHFEIEFTPILITELDYDND
jgi:hypothetical protein